MDKKVKAFRVLLGVLALLMLKSGIHPKIVSERLGHATVAFTLDTYSHVGPGLQEAAAKTFDESIKTNPVELQSSTNP